MTEFKIGDKAYAMKDNKPYEFEVKAIFIRGEGYHTSLYDVRSPADPDKNTKNRFHESSCYKSKEELVKSMFED